MTRFKSVILDVDSTVSELEGIDWLAAQRPPDVAAAVVALTTAAMEARVPLEAVYGRRLSLIKPTRTEITDLASAYIRTALPGVREAVSVWRDAGLRVVLVSGGLRDALLPLSAWLGIPALDVHAVDVEYDATDVAVTVRGDAPLARAGGKPEVVRCLNLPRPILAVGDGATDAELVPHVDRFIAFTGVARREHVVAVAADEVRSFAVLTPLVLGS